MVYSSTVTVRLYVDVEIIFNVIRHMVRQERPSTPSWPVEVVTQLDKDWYYFIHASDGVVLHRCNNVDDDGPATGSGEDLNGVNRTFGTYQVGSAYYMIDASESMFNSWESQIPQNPLGANETLDLEGQGLNAQDTLYFVASGTNQWTDPATVSAEYVAISTYNYCRKAFGRSLIDNGGMTIYSIVHVTSSGQPMDNAYWNGNFKCCGDGDVYFKPLA